VNMLTRFASIAALESGISMGMVTGWTETWDRLAEYLTAA
jgi:hypothetical protein